MSSSFRMSAMREALERTHLQRVVSVAEDAEGGRHFLIGLPAAAHGVAGEDRRVLSPLGFTQAAKQVREDDHRVGRDARLGTAGSTPVFDRLSQLDG